MAENTTDKMPCQATDAGTAQLLANLYGNELRYVQGFGWFKYTGVRWEHDEAAGVQYVRKLTMAMYAMAAKMEDADTRAPLRNSPQRWNLQIVFAPLCSWRRHNLKLNVKIDDFRCESLVF